MKKIILSAVVLMAVLASCSKDGATGPAGATGSAGPALSGTLEGYVDLYDQYGDLMSPATGVYVTIPGKTGTDSTSSSGIFTKSLTTGTYELDFAKTGYAAMKVPSLNFIGGGTQYINAHIQMTVVPNFTLTGITLGTNTVTGNITATVTPNNPDPKARKVICFLSNQNTVSSAPTNYSGFVTFTIPANAATGVGQITLATLNSSGIVSGSILYVAAYSISVNNNASSYLDVATGNTVFNNICATAATANIVVP